LTDDRRLVLFAPTARPTGAASPYRFRQAEIERLSSWARDHDAVIGVREPLADLERPYASAFADLALDVSPRRFPSTATVLRSTSVLVTDYDGCALDFTVTSRPVIAFAHDLDTFADRLLYDLDHMFPGQVCRDFDDLIKTLETVFARPPAPIARQYERVRSLMIDHLDGMNSSRVIDGILELLVGMRR
jgi:CDP-glycerol glycerophosphotransferase (TagB/SpsB family)